MCTKSSYVGIVLAALALHSACSFDPEPEAITLFARTSERVVLTTEALPAESVYWVFTELPLPQSATDINLTWIRVEFTPVLPGEYVVDRWVVSGPAGVWADRFVVVVSGETPVLVVAIPDEIVVGQPVELRVRPEDPTVELVGLQVDCELRYSEVGSSQRTDIGRLGSMNQIITFTPERPGHYFFGCDGSYDTGVTDPVDFEFDTVE